VNKLTNFKPSSFASSAVSNFALQKKRTMVQLTVSMGVRRHLSKEGARSTCCLCFRLLTIQC